MKFAEEAILGEEPLFTEPLKDETDVRLIHAYYWYEYFHNTETGMKWIISYLKTKKVDLDIIEKYSKTYHYYTPMYACALARMTNRGNKIPIVLEDKILQCVKTAINKTKLKNSDKEVKQVIPVIVKTKEKISNIIANIEDFLDQFYCNNYKETNSIVYNLLKSENIKPNQAQEILDYYLPLLKELSLIDSDEQVKEAYSKLTKKQKLNYVSLMASICSDIKHHITNTKIASVRKPRKKKQKSAIQLVSKMVFKKEDLELKITSINPINIIGASCVWLYNTKYKRITKLVAQDSKGLSVKGKTVICFNEKESSCKTVRKPIEFLPKILSGGKIVLRSIIEELKTKEIPPNGRINSDTVILRAIK